MFTLLRGGASQILLGLNAELLTTFGEYDNNGAGFGADE
jgi:hypothetical protein